MKGNYQNIDFVKCDRVLPEHYDLFLLADPSKDVVDEYLSDSEIFVARLNEGIIGAIVLYPLADNSVEIKNIAVKPEMQGKGIGSFLIKNVIEYAKNMKKQSILIGTANSSIGQLYLYQKLGFDVSEIKKNFFIDKYSEPIIEDGIQAKHMIMLRQKL
ncbi:GNAT family N-acetyltransferase [Leptospira sp. GIMC2001]|uniref:GNAT family N-acetyltransferase n=1 Tax=Leptospira sp. GIMC2001 TaxID=1513297 RepID=UPI00234AD2F0|nr:GNAT family N-acetyltransferase [Leptospira sp. GIMC2001]WCL50011.1 GNAT family N-acetyltransferase [Leptospira sp. GIMC2001]